MQPTDETCMAAE